MGQRQTQSQKSCWKSHGVEDRKVGQPRQPGLDVSEPREMGGMMKWAWYSALALPGGHLPILDCAEREWGAQLEVNGKLQWAVAISQEYQSQAGRGTLVYTPNSSEEPCRVHSMSRSKQSSENKLRESFVSHWIENKFPYTISQKMGWVLSGIRWHHCLKILKFYPHINIWYSINH